MYEAFRLYKLQDKVDTFVKNQETNFSKLFEKKKNRIDNDNLDFYLT